MGKGDSEIALQQVSDVREVLLPDGLIYAKEGLNSPAALRGYMRIEGEDVGEVARLCLNKEKDQREKGEEDKDDLDKSPE